MRILLVSPYYIDSYKNNLSMGSAVKLANNLSKKMEVLVLTSGRKIKEETVNQNLKVVSCNGFLIPDPINYMISFGLLWKFVGLVRSFKPKVVVVSKYMFFSSLVIPMARMMGIPVITVTDTFPGINWFPASRLASVVMWFYARVVGLPLLWLSNKVVILYQGLEPIARRYRLNFVTIHNGVEEKYFRKLIKPSDLKKPAGEFWVGFVGRPESVKGYKQALLIADDLRKNVKIKFIFVGGSEESRVEGNRVFLGFRKDMMRVYQMLDVLILPSRAEGLPNVVMEAMAQGVPVVASAVGGVREIIEDEKNGILVKVNDKQAMKSGVLRLYEDGKWRMKLGLEAKKMVERNFNWGKILEDYQRLIKQVCAA